MAQTSEKREDSWLWHKPSHPTKRHLAHKSVADLSLRWTQCCGEEDSKVILKNAEDNRNRNQLWYGGHLTSDRAVCTNLNRQRSRISSCDGKQWLRMCYCATRITSWPYYYIHKCKKSLMGINNPCLCHTYCPPSRLLPWIGYNCLFFMQNEKKTNTPLCWQPGNFTSSSGSKKASKLDDDSLVFAFVTSEDSRAYMINN